MRQNSINYPGERPAKRADIVEQPGYAGKHYSWWITQGGS